MRPISLKQREMIYNLRRIIIDRSNALTGKYSDVIPFLF